jgi:GTP-binding protein
MIDWVEIKVKAGDGGDGVISFRHEKFAPFGGPDGGDGGEGGNVIVQAATDVAMLRKFQKKRVYRAEDGRNGSGQKKRGRNGKDVVVTVPAGTIVYHKLAVNGDAQLMDLEQPGQQVIAARGGKGGLGNAHFKSSINQAPRIAQRGESGEERSLILELRLIADVGIIGYPNVGKSTLLAAASAAKPEIASYPFTTREPVLGVVEVGMQTFVLAEIPGLIEGAHLGRGLGHDFLRHTMRTKMLIHLIDGSSQSPVKDMTMVNNELSLFDSSLGQKPQLVAVNKIDLPEVKTRLAEIEGAFHQARIEVFFVSAATGEGVSRLMSEATKLLNRIAPEKGVAEEVSRKVFRPQPRVSRANVRKEGDTFVISAPELERLFTQDGTVSPEIRWHLKRQLARLGLTRALEKAGIKAGDKVRCGTSEWEW